MLAILEKIRRPVANAADLRERFEEISKELPAAEARVRAAEQRRASGLLELSDPELEKVEADLRLAIRDRDRLGAAAAELERRAGEAEQAEARAALDAERAAVERRAASVAQRLVKEYGIHGDAICRLLTELVASEEAVREINRRLAEAGRAADALPAVEPRVVGFGRNSEHTGSLISLTSLRPLGPCDGWGRGRAAAENFGLPR